MKLQLQHSRASLASQTLTSPRRTMLTSPRLSLQAKTRRNGSLLSAIQSPLSLANLQMLPNCTEVQDLKDSDAVILELRTQLEDIWHEYASARRRSMSLMEENERMQSKLRNMEASLRQEQYHRQAAEEALQHLREDCQPLE